MRDGATGRLAHQARVFGQRPRAMPGRSRLPRLTALGEFMVIDQKIHAARAGIDTDASPSRTNASGPPTDDSGET